MKNRAIITCLLAAFFFGCASADFSLYSFVNPLSRGLEFSNYRNFTGYGGPFLWKLSWDVIGVSQLDRARIGLSIFNKDRNLISTIGTDQPGNNTWTKSGATYGFIDPCKNQVPAGEDYYTGLYVQSELEGGNVTRTFMYTSLFTLEKRDNYSVPLHCIDAQCVDFVLLNTTTNLKNYTLELIIRSNVTANLAYNYDGKCPTDPSLQATIAANNVTTIQIPNKTQIWFMFSNYEQPTFIDVTWNIIANDGTINEPKISNDLKWGLIIGGIAVAVIIVIIVVVVVVRKKRSNYTQV